MNQTALFEKFVSVLPIVREWIEKTLSAHRDAAVAVDRTDYPRLDEVFPGELLQRAKVVVVDGKVPFPPLSRMGLQELAPIESQPITGITFMDTFFVRHPHQSESLFFHELVHVVQWDRLGIDGFLLAYGVGLMQFGYRNSPLEKIAYDLQEAFDRGDLPSNPIDRIHQGTDAIWHDVTSLFPADPRKPNP